jgi:hypothetical protein
MLLYRGLFSLPLKIEKFRDYTKALDASARFRTPLPPTGAPRIDTGAVVDRQSAREQVAENLLEVQPVCVQCDKGRAVPEEPNVSEMLPQPLATPMRPLA